MATTKQRRRLVARAKWERQQQRQAQRARRTRQLRRGLLIVLAILVIGAALGLGLWRLVQPGSAHTAQSALRPPSHPTSMPLTTATSGWMPSGEILRTGLGRYEPATGSEGSIA